MVAKNNKPVFTNADVLIAGIILTAAVPPNVQNRITSFLFPYCEQSRNNFLRRQSIYKSVVQYAQAEFHSNNFKFTQGLSPHHFFSSTPEELAMFRMLHNHFKNIESGPASITVTPKEYNLIQNLDPHVKRNFHNKDSFFTAKINQTPSQKITSVAAHTVGGFCLGGGIGVGMAYATSCGKKIARNAQLPCCRHR